MTPYERQVLNDAEEQVFQIASDQAESQGSSGIRPPPSVEGTESTLDGQLFGLDFGADPQATAAPSAGAPPPVGCASTITVEFHNVVFDCSCLIIGLAE